MKTTHHTLSPLGQLSGKENVGQLALRISPRRVVVVLAGQVVKLDPPHEVSDGGKGDDPGRRRVLEQVQQQER